MSGKMSRHKDDPHLVGKTETPSNLGRIHRDLLALGPFPAVASRAAGGYGLADLVEGELAFDFYDISHGYNC